LSDAKAVTRLLAFWSVLKVRENSSCIDSLSARNWMSSTSRMSISRYGLRKLSSLLSRMELMNSLVNFSEFTYRTRVPG
jgi:hypothetical protein